MYQASSCRERDRQGRGPLAHLVAVVLAGGLHPGRGARLKLGSHLQPLVEVGLGVAVQCDGMSDSKLPGLSRTASDGGAGGGRAPRLQLQLAVNGGQGGERCAPNPDCALGAAALYCSRAALPHEPCARAGRGSRRRRRLGEGGRCDWRSAGGSCWKHGHTWAQRVVQACDAIACCCRQALTCAHDGHGAGDLVALGRRQLGHLRKGRRGGVFMQRQCSSTRGRQCGAAAAAATAAGPQSGGCHTLPMPGTIPHLQVGVRRLHRELGAQHAGQDRHFLLAQVPRRRLEGRHDWHGLCCVPWARKRSQPSLDRREDGCCAQIAAPSLRHC